MVDPSCDVRADASSSFCGQDEEHDPSEEFEEYMACAVCGDNCKSGSCNIYFFPKNKLRRSPGYGSNRGPRLYDNRLTDMQRIGNVPETPAPLAPMMVSLYS